MHVNPKQIERARLAADMSRADLAYTVRRVSDGQIKATERGISRWERGENRPSDGVIPAIAAATGKPIDFFYEQDEEPVGVGAEEDPSRMTSIGFEALFSDLVERVVEVKVEERLREQDRVLTNRPSTADDRKEHR